MTFVSWWPHPASSSVVSDLNSTGALLLSVFCAVICHLSLQSCLFPLEKQKSWDGYEEQRFKSRSSLIALNRNTTTRKKTTDKNKIKYQSQDLLNPAPSPGFTISTFNQLPTSSSNGCKDCYLFQRCVPDSLLTSRLPLVLTQMVARSWGGDKNSSSLNIKDNTRETFWKTEATLEEHSTLEVMVSSENKWPQCCK